MTSSTQALRHAGAAPRRADRVSEHGGRRRPPRTRIKSGLSFAALAAERGLKEQDIDLGTVTKSAMVDPAVADAAFALKEGEVSAPVKGQFGAVIVTVLKIEPATTKPLAEVAPQIRTEIALERAKARGAGPARQDRGRARRRQHARRGGAEAQAAGRHASTSTAPAAIPTASSSPTFRTPATCQRRIRLRRRRRQRSDRGRRRLHLVRRGAPSRRRATARSTKSKARSSSAGATTRSRRG